MLSFLKRFFVFFFLISGVYTFALEETTGTIGLDFYPLFSVVAGDKLYAGDGLSNTVTVIDTTKNAFVKTILVGEGPSAGFLIGTSLYVTNTKSGTVSIIDTSTDTVKKTLSVERGPRYMLLAGTNLYVANTLGDSVSMIDTTTQSYLRTIPVGSGPTMMAYLAGKLYVLNSTSTSVSFLNTSNLLGTISTALNPVALTTLSGRYLYVTNYGGKAVTIIDTYDTNSTQVSEPKIQIPVGNHPSASVLVGTKIYITNTDDNTVSVIDTATNTVTKVIPV